MKVTEIKAFIENCLSKGVPIPDDMIIMCDDWYEEIPSEYRHLESIELNGQMAENGIRVLITPSNIAKKNQSKTKSYTDLSRFGTTDSNFDGYDPNF